MPETGHAVSSSQSTNPLHLLHEGQAPNLTALTSHIRRYLVVQPAPNAADTAKAALFPWLQALGHDLWSPQVLSQQAPVESELSVHYNVCRYQLQQDEQRVLIDIWGVGESLSRAPARDVYPSLTAEHDWYLRSNGSDWQLSYIDANGQTQRHNFSIFDESFPETMTYLLSLEARGRNERISKAVQSLSRGLVRQELESISQSQGRDVLRNKSPQGIRQVLLTAGVLEPYLIEMISDAELSSLVDYQLSATEMGMIREAAPLSSISLEQVQHHASMVNTLRGNLRATFDNVELDVSSRTGLYYILAAIAMQFHRQDAIPAADLIRPPDSPSDSSRVRPLGKPGWYLDLTASAEELNASVSLLLDTLNLRHRIKARNRGEPFPK